MQHNAVVSENCEKCMQILPATPARMYPVDKSANILGNGYLRLRPEHFGILKGLATSLCQAFKLVYSSWICIMAGMYRPMRGGVGWKCHFNPA